MQLFESINLGLDSNSRINKLSAISNLNDIKYSKDLIAQIKIIISKKCKIDNIG